MRTFIVAGLSVAWIAAAGSARAEPAQCGDVTGKARVAVGSVLEPPQNYDAGERAKAGAIADWKNNVSAQCPGSSTEWAKARNKQSSCEPGMSHVACNISGIPATKP
ncbi:MAG: hypothetical protein ACLPIX_12175 [Rhodomicrobium sp.]